MTTLDRRWLDGLVFAATILLGLLLLPARLPLRVLVLSAVIVALVLAGVFLATFSMQILNGGLASAIFIVALMWIMACVARRRGNRPAALPTTPPPSLDEASPPAAQEGGPANA